MKPRINGCRKYQKNEITQEVEDIITYYPESYLKNLNTVDYKPLDKNDIICEFIIKEKIGEGAFGSVRLGINKQTGEKVAIKILEKLKLKKIEEKIRLEREIEILKKLKHPNIVQLYCVIETEKDIYLIMEYIKGKELFQYIILKKKLSEQEACTYFQQIINAIEYLHKLKIAHRDIKPENMIIEQNTKNIKLIDFGLSNYYGDKPNEMLSTSCGSPSYAAPEMIIGKMYRGGGVDIWSLGVVLYSMICGYLPFHDDSNQKMYTKITEGKYTVPGFVSKLGRELIHKILNINPKKRISIQQIRRDSWIKFYSNGLNKEGKSLFSDGLFINKYVIPIDEEIIDIMESLFKIPKIKSRTEVLLNNSNDYTSIYYLLINKKVNNGKKSISDFKSDLFLSYIKDNKNLLSNYDNKLENVVNARKNGILDEQENKLIKKERCLLNSESNVKSQDNIYNIYFKNNTENKLNNFSINNSSNNIINNLINNSNKMLLKQKNNINVLPLKNLKNKFKSNLNIENDKKSYTDRNNLKNIIPKTTKNNKNLILKTIFVKDNKNKILPKNYLDINTITNNYKINISKKSETISPSSRNKKLKNFQSGNSINRIKKKYSEEKSNNKKNDIKITNFVKYSQDEIEEKILKSIDNEDKNQEIKINININKNNINGNKKNDKDNINININIINTGEKSENIHNEIKFKERNFIKYKETISPIFEPQKTINNTLESNKVNYYKTLDSITQQTINQQEVSRSNNKKRIELTTLNSYLEKEETYKNNRKKGLFSSKTNKNLKKKQKTSKLLKNCKSNEKTEIKRYIKNIPNNTIKNIIKKITIDNNNNYLYNRNNFTVKNCETYDYSKKMNKENYSKKKFINNRTNNKTITNFENTSNNNKLSFSPIINKDIDFKLEINKKYKEKINKIINNIKKENNYFNKNLTNISRNYKSIENDKNVSKRENKINSYKSIKNKNRISYLKRINTDIANNKLKTNFFHNKYKSPLSPVKNKKSLIQENIYKNSNTERKNEYQKEFVGIFSNNNILINKNLLTFDFQMSNNDNKNKFSNKNKNDIKKNILNFNHDFEPFDLSCIFYLSNKEIKKYMMKRIELLKYKVKQINTNKYEISYEDNKNIYEYNLSKNYSGIIKFRRIKGINNNYINDIRNIISKLIIS